MTLQNQQSPSTVSPSAYRAVTWLVASYLMLSVLTVAALAFLSEQDPALVNQQAWVRGVIVAVTSVLTFVFAKRAAAGHPRALLRLRIIVIIILVAIVAVLFFLHLPAWMATEQAVCGVLLLATALLVFPRARLRLR